MLPNEAVDSRSDWEPASPPGVLGHAMLMAGRDHEVPVVREHSDHRIARATESTRRADAIEHVHRHHKIVGSPPAGALYVGTLMSDTRQPSAARSTTTERDA